MLFFMGKYKSKKVEDGGYLWNGGDAYANKCSNLQKGDAYLSALETIELLLGFGMFIIALIQLIVNLPKNDKK